MTILISLGFQEFVRIKEKFARIGQSDLPTRISFFMLLLLKLK